MPIQSFGTDREPARQLALVLSDRSYNVNLLASVILDADVASLERPVRPEGAALVRSTRPDIVFFVGDPAREDDVIFLSQLAAIHPGELVAMVPAGDANQDIRMLTAGADACIHDDDTPALAIAVTRAVLRRGPERAREGGNGHGPVEVGDLTLLEARREILVAGRPARFTVMEFQILAVLMQNPDVVFVPGELLEQATGHCYPEPRARDTAKVYVSRIRARLEGAGLPRTAVVNIRGVGYMLQSSFARTAARAVLC